MVGSTARPRHDAHRRLISVAADALRPRLLNSWAGLPIAR
jgi:hypothetical protein